MNSAARTRALGALKSTPVRWVVAAIAGSLIFAGCGCSPASPPRQTYFASPLWFGDISFDDWRPSTMNNETYHSNPVIKPGMVHLGAGEDWFTKSWTGWGTSEAVGTGWFQDHGKKYPGAVRLSRIRRCGSRLMYTKFTPTFSGTKHPSSWANEITYVKGCTKP